MSKLVVEHVSTSFDGVPILEDVSLRLEEGELVCLLGVSGSPEWFEGEVAARVMLAGGEMWVVAPKGTRPTPEEVRRATAFLGPAEGVEVAR